MLPVRRLFAETQSKERDSRSNTSGTELSILERRGELRDGITGTGEEVQEERGGDILVGRVLDLLEGRGQTVLVGAGFVSSILSTTDLTHVSFREQATVMTES